MNIIRESNYTLIEFKAKKDLNGKVYFSAFYFSVFLIMLLYTVIVGVLKGSIIFSVLTILFILPVLLSNIKSYLLSQFGDEILEIYPGYILIKYQFKWLIKKRKIKKEKLKSLALVKLSESIHAMGYQLSNVTDKKIKFKLSLFRQIFFGRFITDKEALIIIDEFKFRNYSDKIEISN